MSLISEQAPLFRSIPRVRNIENVPHPVFDHMLQALVFICLDRRGKISVLKESTELCILMLGAVLLSFLLLLYFLAVELSIMHWALPILMVLVKIALWNHPVILLCVSAEIVHLGIRVRP